MPRKQWNENAEMDECICKKIAVGRLQ